MKSWLSDVVSSKSVIRHYRELILCFYLIWYLYIVICYFDADPPIWINALVIAIIVGFALNLSAFGTKRSVWLSLRFFLIPFAVSSYTALIRDKDFFIIFPSNVEVAVEGVLICLLLVTIYYLMLCKNKKT